jgi:hypothetical protein
MPRWVRWVLVAVAFGLLWLSPIGHWMSGQ